MNPGLYKTVQSVPFLSAPPNYPNSHILWTLPEGVKIKSDAYGTERSGYAHVYEAATNTEGWIAVQYLTPYEDSVRVNEPPVVTKPPIARSTSPSTTASLSTSGVDWGTVAKVGAVAVGIIGIAGGTVYYLKKRRRRR
jgi:hypothetical protein